MPNHVETIIEFSGIEKKVLIKDLITKDEGGEDFLDFNKLIPMPKSLEITSGSCDGYYVGLYLKSLSDEERKSVIQFLKDTELEHYGNYFKKYERGITSVLTEDVHKNIFKSINENWEKEYSVLNPETIEDVGKAYIENIKNYGFDTWYLWAIENWGTKWNSYNFFFDEENTFSFQTAWDVPRNILIELSKKYPEATFDCKYADEDYGSDCGHVTLKNGYVKVHFTSYEPNGKTTEDIIKFAIEDVWGDSYEEYLAECED